MKKNLIIRMWGFMFPHIDIRLSKLGGLAFGLMIAKLWEPILFFRLVLVFDYCIIGLDKTCNDILETGLNN
jgi:hypothetical protein